MAFLQASSLLASVDHVTAMLADVPAQFEKFPLAAPTHEAPVNHFGCEFVLRRRAALLITLKYTACAFNDLPF